MTARRLAEADRHGCLNANGSPARIATALVAVGARSPRPLLCVIAPQHRDRALAAAVCAGRFTHGGITLDLGLEPDWLGAGLPEDEEWRIEWSKFYFGLDLAHAFATTGDVRFLDAWQRLVQSWIARVPVAHDPTDVIGRRIQNWIYAWTELAAAPSFPGLATATETLLLESLAAQIQHLRAHLSPERNHRTLELYALFVAALALPELDPDGTLLAFAIHRLHENLHADVLPDGVHRERSTHYHMTTLRTFVAARENARRCGIRLPDGYDDRLERACEFALHVHRPDGRIPALSDADSGSYLDLLALTAASLGRPDFTWVASAGTAGAPPAGRAASFPVGGYFVQRSGWGEGATPFADERYLVFDCGPLGDGGHGHYDLLNVEVFGGRRPLILDPGRYTYSEAGENWRRWFKGTAAHNTVVVDGLDQTPYRRGKPRAPAAHATFLGRLESPGLDVLHGRAWSPAYDAVHERRIVFVAGEYWLIEDRLEAATDHRYDLRFHLAPDADGATQIEIHPEAAIVRAPGLTLVWTPDRRPRLEPGWIAASYGIKEPAPVVSVVEDGRAVRFLTMVLPHTAKTPPHLRVHHDPVASATRVEIDGLVGREGRLRDEITWIDGTVPRDLTPSATRSRVSWIRRAPDGAIVASSGEER